MCLWPRHEHMNICRRFTVKLIQDQRLWCDAGCGERRFKAISSGPTSNADAPGRLGTTEGTRRTASDMDNHMWLWLGEGGRRQTACNRRFVKMKKKNTHTEKGSEDDATAVCIIQLADDALVLRKTTRLERLDMADMACVRQRASVYYVSVSASLKMAPWWILTRLMLPCRNRRESGRILEDRFQFYLVSRLLRLVLLVLVAVPHPWFTPDPPFRQQSGDPTEIHPV